jgi:hypothetical protein
MQPFASSMSAMRPFASSGGSSGVRAAKSTSVEAKLCLVCRVRVQNKFTYPQRMCVSCARSAGYEPRTQKRKLCSVCNQKQSRRDTPNKFCKFCTQKVDGQKVPHQHKLCEAGICSRSVACFRLFKIFKIASCFAIKKQNKTKQVKITLLRETK